ncbi:hypothetical protein PoB_002915700 [Plakobranchus ocellatus]|uniref:Uncharacterized protein n=1 Tax=Plakobranchus ocellatus TaxID=259542 RepID=A0AAV4A727_9GAST|nr:hypothetical protein PoB_002915700 [Plakobranchus ocellatus]
MTTQIKKNSTRHPVEHKDKIIMLKEICQNRNSVMTLALMLFLKEHKSIQRMTQKFCEAGHSCIQEVDSIHSVVERHLRHQEIFSPLGLVKKLTSIRNPKVIQMVFFLDYQSKAKGEFNFSLVPFTQVRQLQVDQTAGIHSVRYKLSHQPHNDWTTMSVRKEVRPTTTRKATVTKRSSVPEIPLKPLKKPCLATEKKKDLTSMLPYMPESDNAYMQSVLMN